MISLKESDYYTTLHDLNNWKWEEYFDGNHRKARKIQRVIDRMLDRQSEKVDMEHMDLMSRLKYRERVDD